MDQAKTVKDAVLWGEKQLGGAKLTFGHGTENALDESAWLVSKTLGLSPQELQACLERPLNDTQRAQIKDIINQRITTRKPAAYLLNEAWFAGMVFYVDERVIVPRSLLGEFILDGFKPWVKPEGVKRILDLCTGSGCLAIALAHAFPDAQVDAVDISEDALGVAEMNLMGHDVADRVKLMKSDLFEALTGKRYDLIVTNPPYVDANDMANLPPEYKHEPIQALAAGGQGLDVINRILAEAPGYLQPQGILVAEMGNSCKALQERFASVPFTWLSTESGDESVFLLSAEELIAQHKTFETSRKGSAA